MLKAKLWLVGLIFLTAQSGMTQDKPAAMPDAVLTGTQPAHCRVIWVSDPATSATISWSTAKPGKTHSLSLIHI